MSKNFCGCKSTAFLRHEQIFDVELVTECIEENDSFKNCYNCLLFEGLNYINSVMILSKNKIYILTNVNISDDLLLYNVLTPIPITFWVLDNYTSKLSSKCKYLQMFDYLKNPSLFNNTLRYDHGSKMKHLVMNNHIDTKQARC